MEPNIIAVIALATCIAAALGYFFSQARASARTAQLENDFRQVQEKQQDLSVQLSNSLETNQTLTDEKNKLEQSLTKIQTQYEHAENAIGAEKERARQFELKLDEATQYKHEAEKKYQATAASLEQVSKQLTEQQARYESEQALSNQLRENLDKEKLNCAEQSKLAKSFEVQLNEARERLVTMQTKVQDLESQLSEAHQAYNQLQVNYKELRATTDERLASHDRELKNFEKQKEKLVEQFKVLSSEVLSENTKALQENNKQSLAATMNPFKESMELFKKEVNDIHHRETAQRGELKKELESLKELNQKITQEAHELSTALRDQKKLQGNWGELVLENVLDRSGLQLGKDYKREVSINTEEGKQRPDAIVYLPQDKHLVIDAKVSLNAYTRYVNSEDELERSEALKEHIAAFRANIKKLSDKDYFRLPGLNSPDMVFMFVPIESAFVEALKADESLFQTAIQSNVLVATPTTLLTSLNIVRQLWRYEDQNKHTVALAQKAESVFKKLNTFLGNFEGIKKGLDKANEAYQKAEGQLVSGRGNLVKQVGEFKNLAPAIKAELPTYFTDKAELEIDYIAAQEYEEDGYEEKESEEKESEDSQLVIELDREEHKHEDPVTLEDEHLLTTENEKD